MRKKSIEKGNGMEENETMDAVNKMADDIISTLGLSGSPIGVRLLAGYDTYANRAEILNRHRYCQVDVPVAAIEPEPKGGWP